MNSFESRLEAPRIKVPQYDDYVDAYVPREFARKLEFTVVSDPVTSGSGSTEDEAGPTVEQGINISLPEVRHTEIPSGEDPDRDPDHWEHLERSAIDDELLRNEIPVDASDLMFQRGENFTDAQIS